MSTQQEKERLMEEFEAYMVDSYGKWKIGRAEAKEFLSQALDSYTTTVLRERLGEIWEEVDGLREKHGFMPLGTSEDPWNMAISQVQSILSLHKKDIKS